MLTYMTTDNPIHDRKRRCVSLFHRRIANPITRRLPTQVLLETTGRVSGQLRRTPIGGRRDGAAFWFVSNHGEASNYVQNIKGGQQSSRPYSGPLAHGNSVFAARR